MIKFFKGKIIGFIGYTLIIISIICPFYIDNGCQKTIYNDCFMLSIIIAALILSIILIFLESIRQVYFANAFLIFWVIAPITMSPRDEFSSFFNIHTLMWGRMIGSALFLIGSILLLTNGIISYFLNKNYYKSKYNRFYVEPNRRDTLTDILDIFDK